MFLFHRSKKYRNSANVLKKKGPNGIYSKEEFKRSIEKERARADRNNHILSLVIFDMGSSDQKNDTTVHLIRRIKDRVRCIDEVGWYDNQRIGIVLPYTSNKGAIRLTENICEFLDGSIPKTVCKVYTYPLDELNSKYRGP